MSIKNNRINDDPWVNERIPFTITKITEWFYDRNLIEGSTNEKQLEKLQEEFGELSGNIAVGNDIRDDIGDMIVVLIGICERSNLSVEECLEKAYEDIKDRKGKMIDGIFVKEEDL